MGTRHTLSFLAVFGLSVSSAHAALIITFVQNGNDVVATGWGTANITDLGFLGADGGAQINLDASSANFRGGTPGGRFVIYQGLTGPASGYGSGGLGFGPGTGGHSVPSFGSGDYFGLTGFNGRLLLPEGYVSGAELFNTTTWSNRTLANLGLAPPDSSFTYTWGSGANADSLTVRIGGTVPEPSTALLVALALMGGGLSHYSRRLPRVAAV